MTKTTIFAVLRLVLSLAVAGPAQAWGGPAGFASSPSDAHIRKTTTSHPHLRNTEHETTVLRPMTRLPGREEDPLAMMHFE
jgi:hypothetical protein